MMWRVQKCYSMRHSEQGNNISLFESVVPYFRNSLIYTNAPVSEYTNCISSCGEQRVVYVEVVQEDCTEIVSSSVDTNPVKY